MDGNNGDGDGDSGDDDADNGDGSGDTTTVATMTVIAAATTSAAAAAASAAAAVANYCTARRRRRLRRRIFIPTLAWYITRVFLPYTEKPLERFRLSHPGTFLGYLSGYIHKKLSCKSAITRKCQIALKCFLVCPQYYCPPFSPPIQFGPPAFFPLADDGQACRARQNQTRCCC